MDLFQNQDDALSNNRLINTDEQQDFSESYRKLNFQLKEALKLCYENGSQQNKLPLSATSGSKGIYCPSPPQRGGEGLKYRNHKTIFRLRLGRF